MSGVYGAYQINSVLNIKNVLSAIRPWNMAYGDPECHQETYEGFNCALGIYMDHLPNSPVSSEPLLKSKEHYAVIDAVIYNRSELQEEYALPQTLSDEELLLELILSQGADALSQVNGDFCGAIYNTSTQELTLFRDHCGVSPLLFYSNEHWLAFSSDIRGLVAIPEYPAQVDRAWIYRSVCGYDTSDLSRTEFQGITWVRPATYVQIKPGPEGLIIDEHTYWTLGQKKIRLSSDKAYTEKLRELISDSVSRRAAVYPGSLGVELSGGLDSGVIAILIARLGREGIFYSWSGSPKDVPMAPEDERLVIADICEQEHITCHYGPMTMDLSPDSNVGRNHTRLGLVPDFTQAAEYNYALPPYINTMIICETSQFVSDAGGHVVFSGHGGDEGVSHRCDPFEMYYHHEYLHYFQYMWNTTEGKRFRLLRSLKRCYDKARIGDRHVNRPFNSGDGAPQILQATLSQQFAGCKMPPLTFAFDPIRYHYSGNTNVRLNVAALLGAYSGARYVFPFLDYRVLDYAVSIPRHLYLGKDMNRYIYRQAFKDMMPASLYRCTAKNNPSSANIPEDTADWFQAFDLHRHTVMNKLDRGLWADYLDFEYLDAWVDAPIPADEDRDTHINILRKLLIAFSTQEMIHRVRSL